MVAPSPNTILLTGCPTLLPRRLAEELLENAHDTIVVLTLAKLVDATIDWISRLPKEKRNRIRVIEGDVAAIDLGLAGAEYRELIACVNVIHHAASATYAGVDEKTATYTNVEGAREIVEFARQVDHLDRLVHYSTAFVSGDRTGTIFESDLKCGQKFHTHTQKTRYQAELVMAAAAARLPITVIRPSLLVADSETGEPGRLDGPSLLVLLLLGMPNDIAAPLPAPGRKLLSLVPVDHVARVACYLATEPSAVGQTYHVVAPEELTTEGVFSLIAGADGRRTSASPWPGIVAQAVLKVPGLSHVFREPHAFVRQIATGARYDDRHTRQALRHSGIQCPRLEQYVDRWVDAVKQQVEASERLGDVSREASSKRPG